MGAVSLCRNKAELWTDIPVPYTRSKVGHRSTGPKGLNHFSADTEECLSGGEALH